MNFDFEENVFIFCLMLGMMAFGFLIMLFM